MAKPRLFPTRNDLPADTRASLITLLNQHLADTADLHSQIKQAHWNVKGPNFIALHELFDRLAAEILEHGDTIAERATALGGAALGTVRLAASSSRLPEYPADAVDGPAHVKALADRFAALARSTRAAIATADEADDAGTADLFTQVSRDLDKSLWFLEAHLNG
ncbi:MAG: DNA starvation/stationary phase protection protein Dps [Phycisphaerales bacterium]|nr:DNA starvation/stationary phase protection protein Dps [Phycisphaerales bacterium]